MGLNRQIAMLNKDRTDEVDIDAVSTGSTTPVVREHKRMRNNPRHEPVRFTIVYVSVFRRIEFPHCGQT